MKFREKLAYGAGYLGMGLENSFVLGYLTFFATDVLYIKASLIGIIILLPKLLDVLTDILIINFVDRTDTKWGKYRPWILSGIPLSICMCLLFLKPEFLTTPTQHLLWIAIIYFIMTPVFETMYWCPYLTLGTVISADENDRIGLASFRAVFEQISNLIVGASCMSLVLMFGSSELSYHDPLGWKICALIYGALGIIFTLICFFGIKERVKVSNLDAEGNNISLKEKLAAFKNNAPFWKAIAIFVVLYLPWYGYSTMFSYFCINVLGHEEWVSSLSVIGIFTAVLASAIASPLAKKFGKRQMIAFGAILMVLSGIVVNFVKSFASMMILILFKDFGLVFIYVCCIAYLPDLADYTNWKNHMAVPGIIMGAVSAFQKLAAAAGAYLVTVILTVGKYDSTLAVQSSETCHLIRMSIVISFIIAGIIIFVINHFFRELDPDKLHLYKSDIETSNNL